MNEKIMVLENNKDIDRRLEETTKELQREREKLMAVIRMSGDLIFEYDIAKDQMHYAGPEEGSLYCEKITEGYTEQLLREVDNRTDVVEQQLAEALHSGSPDICIELCKTDEEGNPHWMKVIGQTFYNEKKEPERVLGKVCDIDAQKKKGKGITGKITKGFSDRTFESFHHQAADHKQTAENGTGTGGIPYCPGCG